MTMRTLGMYGGFAVTLVLFALGFSLRTGVLDGASGVPGMVGTLLISLGAGALAGAALVLRDGGSVRHLDDAC